MTEATPNYQQALLLEKECPGCMRKDPPLQANGLLHIEPTRCPECGRRYRFKVL